MKKFLMALVVLAIVSGPALAGPNANGVLMVHNTGVAFSTDPFPTVKPACVDIVNTVAMDNAIGAQSTPVVWKVYAVFPLANTPRLKSLGWGITLSAVNGGGVVIEHNGAPSDSVFFITSAGWPPATVGIAEVGMSLAGNVWTSPVDEMWWFSGYAYAGAVGEPQMFNVVANSQLGNQLFGDDGIPALVDPIAGYGSLGFGQPGHTFCPTGIVIGACCFTTGTCQMLSAVECQTAGGSFFGGDCAVTVCPIPVYGACCVGGVCNVVTPGVCQGAGGTYYGNGTICEPSPCPVPTETKSWGQIKNDYR